MQGSKDIGLYDENKILKSVETKLKDIYNIDLGDKKLKLKNVTFGDYNYDPNDWESIKSAKLGRDTIGRPYYGDFEISDAAGNITDRKKVKFGVLPVNTGLENFMVDGNFYSIPIQFRLKPGAYSRETERGDYEVFHNVKNGIPMRTHIDPESKLVSLNLRQASIPIYPVLKTLGASDSEIKKSLGSDIFDGNVKQDISKDVGRLYRTIFNKPAPSSLDAAQQEIRGYFGKLETTPGVNEATIGLSTSSVDPRYLLYSSKKLIDVIRGDSEVDNRDDLSHKDVYSVDDIVDDMLERMKKTHKLDWKVKRKLSEKDIIDKIVNKNDVNRAIRGIFTQSDLSRFADQTNPLANEENHLTTTLLGEGGISSADLVTYDAKSLQPSHAGFLDLSHTPESFSAGVTLFLTNDTKKDGKTLKTKVINLKTNAIEWLSPLQMKEFSVAFPGEFVRKGDKWVSDDGEATCVHNGRIAVKSPVLVKYMLASPDGMFDLSSNTVPFIQSNQANRLLTSSKMETQASPLADPDKPMVDVFIGGRSVLDDIGSKYSVRSMLSGVVSEITGSHISVEGGGKVVKHALPHNLPLNGDSFLDSKVRVSVGDHVKRGDLLADTNTTVDGKLSLGKNLNVAYLPYRGLNYEDSTVITESASNKLATEHIHRIHVPRDATLDIKKYRAYSPYDIKETETSRFNDKGIIKPGTEVQPDNIVAAVLDKRVFSMADNLIQRLKKSAVDPYKPNPITWDRSNPGIVTDVVEGKNGTDIYIKTKEPVLPGDKLVGRHGNKTTVSTIIPDYLAPKTVNGEPIDIIIDPLSVPPRINMGQLLETAAGKIAKKLGTDFKVENFSGEDYRKNILDIMAKNGIPEKEDIYDPSTGKTIPGVFTGVQYIHKLKHQVENKMSARGIDEPYNINQQPTRGKGTGGQSIDNLTMNILLAHNARNTLRDSFSIKNNPNREYWRAIQNGEVPPTPKIPYEYGKFEAMLKGMGVNTEHIGTSVKLSPLTDEQTRALSAGKIDEPYKTFRMKGDDISPDKKGLFGDKAGGVAGNVFNHIDLPTRIAAPAYKDAIKAVLGITDAEYDRLLEE